MKRFSLIKMRGLSFKISLMVLVLLVIGIGTTTVVSIKEQTKTITAALIEKNKTISLHLASSAKNAFWSLNWLFVERQMKESTDSEEVIFLTIMKPNGEVYMSSGDKECGEDLLSAKVIRPERQIVKDMVLPKSGEITKLIITPIQIGNEHWSLIMILSLKQVENARQAILKTSIGYGSIIFILGMLISFFFSRGMYRRITQLMEGTKEIAKGNLDYKISEMGRDELGTLATSFNTMTEDLKKTTTSRDLLAKEMAERNKAEKKLRKSEEKYRTILESIEDGYYEVDIEGNFTFVNDSLCRIMGYSNDELIGMNNRDYLDQENANKVYHTFNKVYTTGIPDKGFDWEFIRKDGIKRYVDASASLMKDAEDKPIGFRGIVRDATERKQAEAQLTASLKEKEALLKEVHHRVKNNLQVISSLLSLQSHHIKDKDSLEIFKESQNRVQSMSLIHEKFYQSKDLSRIDMNGYMKDLTASLFRSYADSAAAIKLKTKVADIFLDITTAIPCGLIINELTSNALKHGFPDRKQGEIVIEMHPVNNKIELVFSDTGVGFPEEIDFRNTTTLGMQLVITLVEQLEGTIKLDRRAGSAFTICFEELIYKKRI